MGKPSTIRLLEVEPDIARFLTDDERSEARQLSLPVHSLSEGSLDIGQFLHDVRGFGGLVLDGMLLERLRVGDQVALRLLGPGDIVSLAATSKSMLLSESVCSATTITRIAVFGNEILSAAHRWPRIVAGLHVRIAEQTDRLAAQLVICQLPRVDQRLLALMWLLAEAWGQVTPSGTTLPLTLTHDALGAMVGARRPTVTLALGELTGRGAIVRQDRGWLLLERPPEPSATAHKVDEPRLALEGKSSWAGERWDRSDEETHEVLREAVARLHEEHDLSIERVSERLRRLARTREHCHQVRQRVARDALSRRRAPS